MSILHRFYYFLKPLTPRILIYFIRKMVIRAKLRLFQYNWPIDKSTSAKPKNWCGWPDNKRFAVILSHDVEHLEGFQKVPLLAQIDSGLGFTSCFNFVPRRYAVDISVIDHLNDNGFEVGVHGLYHDGKLFLSRRIFNERKIEINKYIKLWRAVGFYSPSTIRNLGWLHDLAIEYDSSTFDTDPFEPQPEAAGSIYPYLIESENRHSYIEIPYTLPQDFTMFIMIQEKNIDLWKKKIDWIVQNGGMVHIRTHPDYMNFDNRYTKTEYPVGFYRDVLSYIATKYKDQYWNILPRDLGRFWKQNNYA